MLQTLLFTAVSALGGASQAVLHPADADVYVELSDVPALVRAYEKAPVLQMVRDPATGKIADAVKEAVGFDLRGMIAGLLPVTDAARPDDPYWPWSALQAVSFSAADLERKEEAMSSSAPFSGRGWFVMDFRDPAAAEQALKALHDSGPAQGAPETGGEHVVIGEQVLSVETLSRSNDASAWVARDGVRLLGGFGRARAQDLAVRVAKPETSFLAQREKMLDDTGFPAVTGTVLARAWSDLAALPDGLGGKANVSEADMAIANLILPSVLPFVGQKGRWRLQLCNDRFVSDSLVEHIGPARQLDELYGTGGIPSSALRMVPRESVGAWVMKTRPVQVEALFESLLSKAHGSETPQHDDSTPKLSAALGDSAALFLLPLPISALRMGGGPPALPIVCCVELKDPAAFQLALDAWLAREKARDAGLQVENKPFHKRPMYTFTLGGSQEAGGKGAGESASKPTLTILDDRVVLTMTRKQAFDEVRRAETPNHEPHAIAAEGAVPPDAFEVSTMDWGQAIGRLYDAGRGMLPMLNQGRETPIDVESLPTSAQLFRFFRPSLGYSKHVDGRTYAHNETSFGPEVPALIAAAFVGLVGTSTGAIRSELEDTGARPEPKEARAAKPQDAPAGDAPEKSATLKALRSVRTGLVIYKSQYSRVPASLDELVKGSDAFPKGFLETQEVPKDGWGHALVYAARAGEPAFDLRSMGPNGVDDQGNGDDVSLP